MVSRVVEPPVEGVQRYQMEAPPALPAWLGSPGSLVAPAFDPFAVPDVPETTCALAKLSLTGAAAWLQSRVTKPVALL